MNMWGGISPASGTVSGRAGFPRRGHKSTTVNFQTENLYTIYYNTIYYNTMYYNTIYYILVYYIL